MIQKLKKIVLIRLPLSLGGVFARLECKNYMNNSTALFKRKISFMITNIENGSIYYSNK